MPDESHATGRRATVRRALRDADEPLSIAELAASLGVHPNTVRFHLERLIADGQVERLESAPTGRGRPALLFRAVASMDSAGPRQYRLLAEALSDALAGSADARERAREAGRSWWRRSAERLERELGDRPAEPVPRLIALLDALGFAPERDEPVDSDRPLRLRHCPFLDLTSVAGADRTDTVCPVHQGLMEGALESWSAEAGIDRLDPLVEPDLCVAHLAPRV